MAEFNIDRIRFRWKNIWANTTAYIKDDIVHYQGKAYVCLIGHTSQTLAINFYLDLNDAAPKWELMLDGFVWRGNWTGSTFYSIGEIVKWEGWVYQCITSHTSNVVSSQGVHTDYDKWTIIAKTDNWLNVWTVTSFYDLGDVVTYNGITYRCISKHTSASTATSGLEVDQSNWEIVTRSDNWRTDWAINTRYRVDDVIRYTGIVYRCVTGHTSAATTILGLETDQSKWQTVIDAIEYKSTWAIGTRYNKNDLVKYGETIWKCVAHHTASGLFRTDEAASRWVVWLPGFGYELVWTSAVEYQIGDIVLYGGYTYTCLQNNLNSVPSVNGLLQDTGNWELLKQGYKHRGLQVLNTQYYTGDVVRNGGYLYICITDSINEEPDTSAKWQILVPGHRWRSDWIDNLLYQIGDIVTYDGNAYYCILRHTGSESDNRPDLDILNEHENYWEVMLQGIEGNVLTTDGDIRVRDSSQTERLPIGTPGSTLKASGGNTVWQDFGNVTNVFYVSVTGLDNNLSGSTVNAPFKTIKYACDYINADWNNRAPATIYVTAGKYSEITPIQVPANTTIVGDELRSVTIEPIPSLVTNNMFYVRNGGGVRNCTLQGLVGTLGANNAFGTKRPTAGAFISLDPGAGPTDTSVHITTRSPYVQNVTTFGTGCVGIKIDGALHNAGYRSIVANDFTQILSDGIGAWASNNGRAELVSVFTYYNHIGYLSSDGGKLRATNGNNSYGTFGSVAEGFDTAETAITGTVTNRAAEATANALTDNANFLLALEYKNAGTTYTAAGSGVTFAGQGVNASASYQETRDDGVYEVRLTDPGDSSAAGGNGYQYKLNSAQDGDLTTLTLAASDTDGTNAKYAGLRVYITEGPGVGQYGFIASYDAASKVAQISRESDGAPGWDHVSPGWANVTDMTTATRYSLEPRVTFSDHTLAVASVTAPSSTNWTHVIWFPAGNSYVAFTNGTTVLSSHSSDGITWSTPATRLANHTVTKVISDTNGSRILICTTNGVYGFGTANLSDTNICPSINTPFNTVDVSGAAIKEGSQIFTYASNTHQLTRTSNLNTVSTITPIGASSGGTHAYKRVAFGAGVGTIATSGTFVAINEGTSGGVAVSSDLMISTYQFDAGATGRLPTGYTDIVFGNGRFVAINPGDVSTLTKTAISFDGLTWYEHTIPGATDYLKIEYGGGTFMATGTGTQIAKSQDGVVWRITSDDSTDYNTTESASWSAQAYSPTLQKWSIVASNNTNWNTVTGWGAKPFARAVVKSDKVNEFFIYEPGSQYASTPTVSVYDSQATVNSTQIARIGDGVLAQPVFANRGTSYITATSTITGDGYADSYQIGKTLNLAGVSLVPSPGDNLVITGIDDVNYKVSSIDAQSGSAPNFALTLTISPTLGRAESPEHATAVTIRQQYSQVRLTGHDFLDIGSGNKTDSDYPNRYVEGYNSTNDPKQQNEVREFNAGRVFYTSTDQDGNFRVGEQFKVEQDTGIITINASYFELSGLTQLTIGGIQVGGTAVVINEFSKEPTFIANADNIVPTQKAVARYLESRVSGGTSSANATRLIAGTVEVHTDTITSTDPDGGINVTARMHHTKPPKGDYAALQYFAHGTGCGNMI